VDRVTESLFVGTLADASDEGLLAENGVETVVSLTHADPDAGFPDEVSVIKHHMLDGPQNDRDRFEGAVEAVRARIESGETVLVHCSRGASRSPSVAAAATALARNIGIETAFERVAENVDTCDPHDALVRQAVTVYRES